LLQSAGADAQIHIVEGRGPRFTMPTTWPDAEKAIFDFLAKNGITKMRKGLIRKESKRPAVLRTRR